MLALGRLLRLSLSPSAPADVAAGILFAAGTWPAGVLPWLLLVASLAVYHGGMALNDWADRARDAETCPSRPLPAGEVAPGVALVLALVLLVGGPLLAGVALPAAGFLAAAVALGAATYDLVGRGPVRGPLLLALCRAGNLSLGLCFGWSARSEAASSPASWAVLAAPAVLYGAYVFVVSRLGRLEDAEDPRPLARRPSRLLALAAVVLLAVAALPLPDGSPGAGGDALLPDPAARFAALAIVTWGVVLVGRRARHPGPWTAEHVRRSMGTALRCLLLFTAALAVLPGTAAAVVAAGLILAGFPVGVALRRVFPPS